MYAVKWHAQHCFPGGSVVKNLPAKPETVVWSLGWEDPLEKEMATHSSLLAWEIPWTEEPGKLVKGSKRVKHNLLIKPSPPNFCRMLNLTKSQYSHPYSVLNNIIILGYLTYSYMSLIIYQEVPKCFTNTAKFNLHVKPISTITIPVL